MVNVIFSIWSLDLLNKVWVVAFHPLETHPATLDLLNISFYSRESRSQGEQQASEVAIDAHTSDIKAY